MNKKISFTILMLSISAILLFINSCCLESDPPCPTPQTQYAIDTLPGCDDCPLELDKAMLAELVEDIKEGEYGKIHSLIIIHNTGLALEEYFMEWTRHMLHPCFSATKSFTSALIGIAIKQGYISGVDEMLLSFFPEYDDIENLDERKESITLENVLTMTAGFTWDETSIPYRDNEGNPNLENDYMKLLLLSDDWIKSVLDLPMSNDPGEQHVYNSGCTTLLSGIIENETGQTAEEFAKEHLFSKIGITKWEWETGTAGMTNTGSGLYLHPVNMAMFGYLYLKNGVLNGEQIVAENWVKESTSPHIEVRDPVSGELIGYYGYEWRTNEADPAFNAYGFGGQVILVLPSIDLVLVTTAENGNDRLWIADIVNKIVEALVVKS
jgi:CubicO group peptidase (beta-lactamase class C family)